jgi:hypothetical protein
MLGALALASCGDPSSIEATRADFEARGLVWPFVDDTVRLGCEDHPPARDLLWVEAQGRRWALHGRSRGRYPDPDPILRVDERMVRMLRGAGDTNPYEPRIDPADAREEARKLCAG